MEEQLKNKEECFYMVKFRVIYPEYMYTPLMFIPVEKIKIRYKHGITDKYMLCVPVGKELNINPDYIKVEEFEPCDL